MNVDPLADAFLRRAVQVNAYGRGQANAAMVTTRNAGAEIRGAVMVGLDRIRSRGPTATPWQRAAFQDLQGRIDGMANELGQQLRGQIAGTLRDFAKSQARWTVGAASSAGTVLQGLDGRKVITVAGQPIAGRSLEEWTQSLADRLSLRLKTELATGLRSGESDGSLGARVRDALQEAERNAGAIAKTGVRHVAAQVTQQIAEQNPDLVRGLMWVATLERTTCPTCWGRHGRVWRIDRGPRPPAHVSCACILVMVMRGEPDPEVTDADDWLRAQTDEFQNQALGPTRARMWREGKIGSVRDLTNMRGRVLTLDELDARETG